MRRTACATPRIFTALALASALCLPAAAIAAQFDYYIKLPPIEGETTGKGKQIEIHSFAWSASQSPRGHGGGHGTGKVAVHDISIHRTPAAGEIVGIEPAYPASGDSKAAGTADKDMVMKGSKIGENSAGKRTPPTVTLKRGMTAAGDGSVAVQYNPKELSVDKQVPWNAGQPAPTGSVTVRGKFPSCTVGVRYPTLELGVRGQRYTLSDVVVSSCGGSADGGSQPMEEVSFNYSKIKT